MKWMIASDIHGSAYYCRMMLDRYAAEGAGRLLLLGDILYHGPRNDLPRDYAPKRVAEMLNGVKNGILCVGGNCDAEVDQLMLEFPILAGYAVIDTGERLIFATHGHRFGQDGIPPLKNGDILLYGHTHIPECAESDGIRLLNPGSVSIPKEGSAHSYMTYENGVFRWLDTDGAEYNRYTLD